MIESSVIIPCRVCFIPADTLRNNDLVITSKRHHFGVITSKWRRFDVITTLLLRHVFRGILPLHLPVYELFVSLKTEIVMTPTLSPLAVPEAVVIAVCRQWRWSWHHDDCRLWPRQQPGVNPAAAAVDQYGAGAVPRSTQFTPSLT